jgi:NAD(P)-dependent dehydrogenase (short-subunit alcohol dehydrogenase family)
MGILDDRVVLVTGGGNGIGRDAALIAAKEGAKVLVSDLGGGPRGGDGGSAGPAEAVAKEIRDGGGKAISNHDSVTDYDAMVALRETALKEFGGLHAVINPAGILRDAMFHKMAPADWDLVVEVHLRGTFNVCRATIELFRDQNDGAYVLFSSTSGLIGNVGQSNYGSAKMGIAGLSRIIAMEGVAKNVRSNALAPVAYSRLTAGESRLDASTPEAIARREEMAKMMAARMPAEAPAKLAVALASPLTKDTTGQIFGVQGNDISVMQQIRTVAYQEEPRGWTVDEIVNKCLPALKPSYTPFDGMGNITRPPQKVPA